MRRGDTTMESELCLARLLASIDIPVFRIWTWSIDGRLVVLQNNSDKNEHLLHVARKTDYEAPFGSTEKTRVTRQIPNLQIGR